MARHVAWILAVGLACASAPSAAVRAHEFAGTRLQRAQQPAAKARPDEGRRPRFVKWWVDPASRAELGIGDEQSARIEAIWDSALTAQRERYREIEKLESTVAQLVKEGTADPSVVEREVERLERLSAEARTTRTVMLYRMHRELTADQRATLKAITDRREAERRKSSESKPSGRRP